MNEVRLWETVSAPDFLHMKNNFTFILLMLLTNFCNAQKWHIGLVNGINFPNTHSEIPDLRYLNKENRKKTMIFGTGFLLSHNKYINMRGELFYEERGWFAKNAFTIDPNSGNSYISKINYFYPFITMPVLIEGKAGRKIQVFANAGINTSLRIGGKTITEDGNIPTVFIFPEDKKPTFDFAWIGGGGVRVPISKRFFLQTEYRYYRSWTPIGVGYSIDSVIKHKGFLLNLSCYFRI